MDPELKKFEKIIKPMMSEKRFIHSVNVADMCLKLAKKFKADEDKAYTAGILHDCRKEIDAETMLFEVKSCGFFIDPAEYDCQKLWHAPAGAYYAKSVLKIADEEILGAIRFHTVGRANMPLVEKIVFLADMVSADRDFPDVEKYRRIVLNDLDEGMFAVMRYALMKNAEKKYQIPLSSLEGYNFYLKRTERLA